MLQSVRMFRFGFYLSMLCGWVGLQMSAMGNPENSSVELHHPGACVLLRQAPVSPAFAIKLPCDASGRLSIPDKIAFRVSNPRAVDVVRLRQGTDKVSHLETEAAPLVEAKPSKDGVVLMKIQSTLPHADANKNLLWLDVQLSKKANIGSLLTFSDVVVTVKGKETKLEGEITQRIGHMIVAPGAEVQKLPEGGNRSCHTFSSQAFILSQKGTIIGLLEALYHSSCHATDDKDVVMVKSRDGGLTWTEPEHVIDFGMGSGCCVLTDKKGRIWMQSSISGGLNNKTYRKVDLYCSSNDGKSWKQVHPRPTKAGKVDYFKGTGGRGITLRDGTLVFPAVTYKYSPESLKDPQSTIRYSKDGGKSWKLGKGVPQLSWDSQVVELDDGSIMINCENCTVDRQGRNYVYVSKDLGETWEPHITNNKTLGGCQTPPALLRFKTKTHNLLIFASKDPAHNYAPVIRYSEDEGQTWSDAYVIDNSGIVSSFGIQLMQLNPTTVGMVVNTHFLLREGNIESLVSDKAVGVAFLSIPLESILTGKMLPVQTEKEEATSSSRETLNPSKKKSKKKSEKKSCKHPTAEA